MAKNEIRKQVFAQRLGDAQRKLWELAEQSEALGIANVPEVKQ